MVIIIGNQKGGAGKSTLTLLLANYLTQERQRPVTVIDMDYQQSLAQKFERAKVLENAEPYAVVALALDQFSKEKKELKDNPEVLFLVDLPGKLDDDGLIEVFKAADLAICPFSYDEFSFESTVFFSLVLKKIKPAITIVYISPEGEVTINTHPGHSRPYRFPAGQHFPDTGWGYPIVVARL